MHTDLSKINRGFFYMRPCNIAGDECVLVEPHEVGSAKWDKDNLIFRSSIWNSQGKLVSASFPKFFNWDEDLDREGNFVEGKLPIAKPTDFSRVEILDKLDGSCLIASFYKGELILRTRGTVSAEDTLSNGHEVAVLRAKYPRLFAYLEVLRRQSEYNDVEISYVFEWFSPLNRIVLDYGPEPQLWLIGGIYHSDYSFLSQSDLDDMAGIMNVPRPNRYPVMNLAELRTAVNELRDKEGMVFYIDGWPWKIKSLRYLALHYSKGKVNTFDKVVDTWLEFGRPDYQQFFDLLVEKEDWETANYARPSLSKLADAKKIVDRILAGMRHFITEQLQGLPRKIQYERVVASYGQGGRAGIVMGLLDGKQPKNDQIKKLILQSVG